MYLLILPFAVLVAFAGLQYRALPIIVSLLGWVLLPSIASRSVTGLPVSIHPSSIVIIASFILALSARNLRFSRSSGPLYAVSLFLAAFLISAEFQNILVRHVAASPGFVDEYLAPVCFFYLIISYFDGQPELAPRFCRFVIALALMEVAVATAQRVTGKPVFYASSFSSQYWFPVTGLNRSFGTLDHPLVLGMFLACCVPMLATAVRDPWLRFAIALALTWGCALSAGRVALVASLLGTVYLLFRIRTTFLQKVFPLGLLGAALYFAIATSAVQEVISRFSNDRNSSSYRGDGYVYILHSFSSHILTGGGTGSSFALAGDGILYTSLENALLMNIYDYGAITAAILVCTQALVILTRYERERMVGIIVAAFVSVVMTFSFSSTSVPSLAAPLLWMLLALSYSAVSSDEPTRARHSKLDYGKQPRNISETKELAL